MTMQPPRTDDAPSPSTAATPRASRVTDYRLRGLDLEAPVFTDVAPRPVRTKHPSRRRHRRRLVVQWLVVVAVIAGVAALLRIFVVTPYSVTSTSMVPTLAPGTDVLVVKWTRLTGSTKAGDIVVVDEPRGSACTPGGGAARDVVARVIGMPGETIWSVDGTIYVNGQRLDEPGWYNPPFGEVGATDIARTAIPSGSYFVMGDNRTDTCDSRSFGPVPSSLVVGRVVGTITRHGHPYLHAM